MSEIEERGRAGYEAYAKSTGGKTYDGRDMPTWDGLTDRIREAWRASAEAIATAEREDICKRLSAFGMAGLGDDQESAGAFLLIVELVRTQKIPEIT